MPPTNKTILITGASRGLGRGLLELYLSLPNHTLIAANRDPATSSTQSLRTLPVGEGSKLIIVKIDSTIKEDPFTAIEELKTTYGIEKLDLVIANAGISTDFPTVRELDVRDLQRHIEPNVFGVVWLYQAARGLLENGERAVWVTMGSSAGSLENQPPIPNAAYGPTKAMVHWMTKRINAEEETITAFVMDPGFVQTDMGNNGAQKLGLGEKAPVELADSVNGMKAVIDAATKESHGGKLVEYTGKVNPW